MRRSYVKPQMARVLAAAGLLIVLGIAIAGLGHEFHSSDSNKQGSSPGSEGVPAMVFSPTGTYASGDASGTGIVVHTFRVTPEYTAVTYTAAVARQNPLESASLRIVDDTGYVYSEKDNVSLGSADGVLAGILVVEPYVAGGSLLTLEVDEVRTVSGSTIQVGWKLPLLRTVQPDEPVSFYRTRSPGAGRGRLSWRKPRRCRRAARLVSYPASGRGRSPRRQSVWRRRGEWRRTGCVQGRVQATHWRGWLSKAARLSMA